MLRHYISITIRNLMRDKGYTASNVLGLALGLACCILIGLYIRHELSYDRHYPNADRIYRIVSEHSARTPDGLGEILRNDLVEVEQRVRLQATFSAWLMTYGEKAFYEQRVFTTEQELFELFEVPFIQGDPTTALSKPNSMVITELVARKLFEGEDPIGKVVQGDGMYEGNVASSSI